MINHNITFMISSPSHTTFHHPPPTQKYLVPIYHYSYDCTMYMGIFWGGGFSEICGFLAVKWPVNLSPLITIQWHVDM